MNRWDNDAIEYNEVDKIREALVGRSIVSTLSEGTDYERVLSFVLDDGTVLKAHATDGGCACTNGCFTVAPGSVVRGTITNVEVKEYETDFDGNAAREVALGEHPDSGRVNLFVYTDLGEHVLIESEGGDNGYYGWGFWLSVVKPEVSA